MKNISIDKIEGENDVLVLKLRENQEQLAKLVNRNASLIIKIPVIKEIERIAGKLDMISWMMNQ